MLTYDSLRLSVEKSTSTGINGFFRDVRWAFKIYVLPHPDPSPTSPRDHFRQMVVVQVVLTERRDAQQIRQEKLSHFDNSFRTLQLVHASMTWTN